VPCVDKGANVIIKKVSRLDDIEFVVYPHGMDTIVSIVSCSYNSPCE